MRAFGALLFAMGMIPRGGEEGCHLPSFSSTALGVSNAGNGQSVGGLLLCQRVG